MSYEYPDHPPNRPDPIIEDGHKAPDRREERGSLLYSDWTGRCRCSGPRSCRRGGHMTKRTRGSKCLADDRTSTFAKNFAMKLRAELGIFEDMPIQIVLLLAHLKRSEGTL